MSQPTNNDIVELRGHLFDTLRAVKAGTMDTDRARAINQVAAVIVDTARVEIEHTKAIGNKVASPFLLPQDTTEKSTPTGVLRVTQHRMAG